MPRSAALSAIGLLVVGALAVVPVWLSPVLVTTDGPSHVYNAMLADAVRAARPPWAGDFRLVDRGLAPNQTNGLLLLHLGRLLGWEPAERVVMTIAVVAGYGVLLLLLAPLGRATVVLGAPLVAWLAHNWFVWMGFYDFGLSVAGYAALVLLLARPPTLQRTALLLVVLAFLYFTHFFTFAMGTGLALTATAWRVLTRRGSWSEAWPLVPAVLVLLVVVGSGGAGAGAMTWSSPWKAVAGLVFGDIVRSFHPWEAGGGVAVMAGAWLAIVSRVRQARRGGLRALSGADAFGILLLALSLVAPEAVGVGGYVPVRLQLLGVVTLLPAMAAAGAAAVRAGAGWLRVGATVVLLGFAAHALYIVRVARVVNGDLATIDRLLGTAGSVESAWVRTRLVNWRRGLFRISGYRHLVERIAMRRRLVVADNYEALYQVFPLSWRARPDWLAFRPGDGGLVLELVPGDISWPPPLYVVHESALPLGTSDSRLELGRTAAAGAFAVTPVTRGR